MSSISNVQILQEELLCPVLREPLTHAVFLVPCSHKIQQAAAEVFGPVLGEWRVSSGNVCPVCQKTVLGYLKDHATRNIVEQLLSMPPEKLSALLTEINSTLPPKGEMVDQTAQASPPYPGKAAKFLHSGSDTKGNMVKEWDALEFSSAIEDSLITKFYLTFCSDGKAKIRIRFLTHNGIFTEYLKKFNIHLDLLSKDMGTYTSETKEELRTLFTILANNNEIPVSHFEYIRQIVEKGEIPIELTDDSELSSSPETDDDVDETDDDVDEADIFNGTDMDGDSHDEDIISLS